MGNLFCKNKVNKYNNKAINFNEKLIQIERDICNEKETDNPIYYIKKYGPPYHIYNDMKIIFYIQKMKMVYLIIKKYVTYIVGIM